MEMGSNHFYLIHCIKSIRIEEKIIGNFTMIVKIANVSRHFRALNFKNIFGPGYLAPSAQD